MLVSHADRILGRKPLPIHPTEIPGLALVPSHILLSDTDMELTTVGFGDIVARTDGIRLLVTGQMVLNLIVVGAVIRLLVSAARRGIERGAQANPHMDS